MTENTIDNARAWESYWSTTANSDTPVLWNSDPARAAAVDLLRFKDVIDSQLPLIDFGCGDGNQTRFFANHFQRVIGVDVSKSAVALAQAKNSAPNIEYRVLDALQPEQAAALHSEIGDANVYTRGAMHQLDQQQRTLFAQSIELLLGKKGILYLIDLSDLAKTYFASIVSMHEGTLPEAIARVFALQISKGSVTRFDIATTFTNFEVLADGEDVIHTIQTLPKVATAKVPAYYAVLRYQK